MAIRHHHQQSTNTYAYSVPHVLLNGGINGIHGTLLFLSGVVPNSILIRLVRDPRSWFGPPPDIKAERRRLGLGVTVMRRVVGMTSSSCPSCESSTSGVHRRIGARGGMIMSGLVSGEYSCWVAREKYLVALRLDSGMDWSRSWGRMSVKAQRGCRRLAHSYLPALTRSPLLRRSPFAISD